MMEVDPISSPTNELTMDDGQNSNSTPGSNEQVSTCGAPSDDLWLDFKCVFCNEGLKNIVSPRLLQCLHTACASCLTTESNNSPTGTPSSTTTTKQLSCPACSQEINLDDVVEHLFLTEYLQNVENLPEESTFPCTSCEEGAEGTAFCEECQEWLCPTCVSAHHRVRITKDHTVRSKEEMDGENVSGRNQKYMMCQVHNLEQLKLYCETCDKLTCRDCQLSMDHKDHKFQFLTKACEEEKGHINELLTKIKEKMTHIEGASDLLNKKNEEILQRERNLTQDIKTFAVRFITEINKRGKSLLQDLEKVCTDKKNQLNTKNEELRLVCERLKHCQKFAEAAVHLGSDTALVYSKKPIMNQLRCILKHRCEVPNPHHSVNIVFNYESSFLTQYISSLGQILVDQQPIPGAAANQNAMLPLPAALARSPVPTPPQQPMRQQPIQNIQQMTQQRIPQQQMTQHHQMPMAQQQHNMVNFNQSQVTSSTDPTRSHSQPAPQMRQQVNHKQVPYQRMPPQQRANVQQGQQVNYQMQQQQANANFHQQQQAQQRQQQLQQQQQQQRLQQQQQLQQQQIQQQQQQQQAQQQQQPQQQSFNSTPALPMALRQNSSISVTSLPSPGPSPNKQRAIAPRNNNNQATTQRVSTQSTPQRPAAPQVIVLDDQPNNKTPTMSNTSRLSHFPNIAATIASHPHLQIQPTNNKYSSKF